MPPEMGIALVNSPNTAPIGSRKTAPTKKAMMAAIGPPPKIIQSPTRRTQPVPMMAPKPMVKKFQSVRFSSFHLCQAQLCQSVTYTYLHEITIAPPVGRSTDMRLWTNQIHAF